MPCFSEYMIQHILYIKSVEKSVSRKTPFVHKEPTECAFGKMFYTTVKPNIECYSENQRKLIETLEQTHIQFHQAAQHIHTDNPEIEQYQRDAWLHSAKLVNLLTQLEKIAD